MKNLYNKIVIIGFLILCFNLNLFAQRQVKFVVYEEDAGTNDCDCCGAGDSDWRLSWEGSEVDDNCHSFGGVNDPSVAYSTYSLYTKSIICRSDWPTGNLGYTVYGDEADGTEGCAFGACVGCDYSLGRSEGFPGITTNQNININSGNYIVLSIPECYGSDNASYKARWEITGSWGANQDANGYTTNTTCASAINFTGSMGAVPTNDSWRGVIRSHVKRCETYLYYKFNLTSNVSYFEIDMFNNDGDVEVYYMNSDGSCGCAVTNDAGTFDYDFKKNSPSLGWYVVRLRNGGDYVDIDFRTGGGVARPANDNYCNALSLSTTFDYNSAPLTSNVNTDNASTEDICTADEPYYGNEKTVWWKFRTGSNPPTKITINPSSTTFGCTGQAQVFSGSAMGTCSGGTFTTYDASTFNGLSRIDYTTAGNDFYINCPSPLTTYYIMGKVGGVCNSGGLTINVTSNGAPRFSNDQCSGAIDLGTLTAGATIGNANGSNRWNNFCSGNIGDPNPGWTLDNNIRQPVWFKFNTGSVGRVVDIEGYSDPAGLGDKIDLKLAVYKGPCTSLTYVDRDYDPTLTLCIDGLCDESLTDIKCLLPNTDYFVLVDGSGLNTEGFFGLTVSDRGPYPANDLICGATTITPTTPYTYNSVLLSPQNNTKGSNCFEPNPDWAGEVGQDNDHGIWYYVGQVPGRTMVVDANNLGTAGDDINLQLALYSSPTPKGACVTPTSSPVLTEVDLDNNVISNDEDAYYNCLNPALYYWIMVDGSGGVTGLLSGNEEGPFSLRVWFPEEGEVTCAAAENLGTIPATGSLIIKNLSNMCGATSIPTFAAPSTWAFDKAVVYKFTTPPAGGFTDASILIEAFTNPYYDESTYATPGGGGGAGGNMDMLENAYNSGDDIDLQLAVYSAAPCGSTHNVLGSNYDPTVGSGADITGLSGSDESLIVNCLVPSTEYYLVVDGGSNTSGYFDLKLSNYNKHTTNDFLFNAIDVTGTNTSPWTDCNSNTIVSLNNQNNYCATNSNDWTLPSPFRPSSWAELNGPVWYKFKAPKSGKLQIRAINSVSDVVPPFDEPEIDIQMAVFFLPGGYYGTPDASTLVANKNRLQLIGHDFDGFLHDEDLDVECLMADSIYYLAIDGSSYTGCPGCTRGEFRLEFESNPRDRSAQNDALCDAIDLGTPAVWTNPTIYDTKVTPAAGAATNGSPTTGYPTNTGLHNGARSNANSCMRAENNFCAGIANEPGVSGGTFLTDFSPDATVWYSFTAPTTGEVVIDAYSDPDSRGDQIDLQLAVYESSDGTCAGTMVPIKAEYNAGFFSETMRVQCLNPGQKYWIMVDGSGLNTYGYFELQVQAVLPTLSGPANDDICSATPVTYPASIGTTTTLGSQTNRCATIQTIYSEPTTFTKDADVWYKFTTPNTAAPHAVEVTVTSGLPWPFGDAMDPQIALYKMNPTGGPCASSFTLVDDQYSALGLPFYEKMEFHCLEQNTTYYLMVDGSGLNEQGNFSLDVKRIAPHPLPTNDYICSVGTTTANGYLGVLGGTTGNKIGNTSTNWHNFCSTVETNESTLMTDGAFGLDQTVWFHFKTPATGGNRNVEIRALNDPNNVGDQIDLQMLLVQGNPTCPFNAATTFTSLTPIESADNVLTFNSTINVCLPQNTDFYVLVDGSGLNKQGYFTIEVENMGSSGSPVNDNICSAKTLTIGAGTYTGSGYLNDNNICATLENFENQAVAGGTQRSVWYKFTAPTSADVSIEVKGNSWVPFSTDYFLPDITIWEVDNGTFAAPGTTIGTCAAPTAVEWAKLLYNDSKSIPNSLANGLYPTIEMTPLCLKPNYTYYVQVDGVNGIGLDGYFDIRIKNNQAAYSGPSNNEAANATIVPISTTTCQYGNGTWQSPGGYSFGSNPTWSNPNSIGLTKASPLPACIDNCGDVWFKFQMPAACGNNTKSFIKIEGDDEFNFDLDGYPELAIAAYKGPSSGVTTSLTYLKCSVGGGSADPDFSIAATPGEWIYLQIWDLTGNEQAKTFKLCVSEQKSADDCVDATAMTLDIPYCWSVESHRGETPNSAVPGSGLNTCFNDGIPKHSSYFKFTTDATTDFCDDYYIYIKTDALAKLLPSGASNACLGVNSSVSLNLALYELKSGGTPCTTGGANVALEDCQTWNDCGGGSVGSNVVGPHGNGGILDDTIWYNLGSGNALLPNTTYYIVLDYNIDNIIYDSRVVLDGIIEVGRRCKGRTWEYTTAPIISTDKYCTSRDGWQHYYDDKGTTATGDDRYVFSVYPNGNNIKGTAKVYLNNSFYSYTDIPRRLAEYVMRRRWDFVLTSGFNTINPANPVKVRFYYQNSEKDEIVTAAQSFASTYNVFYEDFEWFKSKNGHEFDVVGDVNPKAIVVGPDGYSETGCLSYWTDAGVYVGPPGVTRCNQKVITDWDDNSSYHEWCNGVHFAEYNGLTGFSGGTGGTGASEFDVSPLPIELTSFTGYHNADKYVNNLNWVTSSEVNSSRFVVEKSLDGASFTYLGEKAGAGNSTTTLNYELVDTKPSLGDNYYRLKMIDKDGTFEYSKIININVGVGTAGSQILGIYPNPTRGMLNIRFLSGEKEKFTMRVINTTGQVVRENTFDFSAGINFIELNTFDFADGLYVLQFIGEKGLFFDGKFVKE